MKYFGCGCFTIVCALVIFLPTYLITYTDEQNYVKNFEKATCDTLQLTLAYVEECDGVNCECSASCIVGRCGDVTASESSCCGWICCFHTHEECNTVCQWDINLQMTTCQNVCEVVCDTDGVNVCKNECGNSTVGVRALWVRELKRTMYIAEYCRYDQLECVKSLQDDAFRLVQGIECYYRLDSDTIQLNKPRENLNYWAGFAFALLFTIVGLLCFCCECIMRSNKVENN